MAIEKYTKIIIESSPDYFLIECGKCNGTGTGKWEECRGCDGVGKQKLKVPSSLEGEIGLTKCGHCDGSGIMPEAAKRPTCKVCKGAGALVKSFPRVGCGKCSGGGIKPTTRRTPCDVCGGAGSVSVDDI